MPPPFDQDSAVLITGASAGIGRQLAKEFAPRVRCLLLVARRADRLEALRDELIATNPRLTIYTLTADLADPDDLKRLHDDANRLAGPVDALVNNAGLGCQALFDRLPWERAEAILRVNVVALTRLTHDFLPDMVARGRGGVLNISSGAGHAPVAGGAVYVASKHYVNGFTKALRVDLRGTGVTASQVSPGPVATEFMEVAGITGADRGPAAWFRVSVEQVAREAVRGFERGQADIFPGFWYRQFMGGHGWLPRPMARWAEDLLLAPSARQLRGRPPSGAE